MTTRYDRPSSTFVPALREQDAAPVSRVTVLPPALVTPDIAPAALDFSRPGPYTGHARADDTAETIARADLLVSAAYALPAGLVTIGILALAWAFRALGEAWAVYALVGLIGWGGAVLWALWANRRQGLYNSPAGIAHHELDARERIALHAINVHAELLRRQLDGGRDYDRLR